MCLITEVFFWPSILFPQVTIIFPPQTLQWEGQVLLSFTCVANRQPGNGFSLVLTVMTSATEGEDASTAPKENLVFSPGEEAAGFITEQEVVQQRRSGPQDPS